MGLCGYFPEGYGEQFLQLFGQSRFQEDSRDLFVVAKQQGVVASVVKAQSVDGSGLRCLL